MLRQTIQGTAFSKKADLKGIEHECGREYLFSAQSNNDNNKAYKI
jgi:hypothetical protein